MTNTTLAPTAPKKLMRSSSHRMIAGVCGGLAEYFDLDPTLVRVAYAVLTIVTGIVPGIIAYLALMFIMPRRP